MHGKNLRWLRKIHTFLGVFFSPLLLLFIITGCWQTFVSDDDRSKGYFNALMSKFSSIHTDDYFPHHGANQHGSEGFKILVASMALALAVSILLGLVLAFQSMKKAWWVVLTLLLGILIPATLLYFG